MPAASTGEASAPASAPKPAPASPAAPPSSIGLIGEPGHPCARRGARGERTDSEDAPHAHPGRIHAFGGRGLNGGAPPVGPRRRGRGGTPRDRPPRARSAGADGARSCPGSRIGLRRGEEGDHLLERSEVTGVEKGQSHRRASKARGPDGAERGLARSTCRRASVPSLKAPVLRARIRRRARRRRRRTPMVEDEEAREGGVVRRRLHAERAGTTNQVMWVRCDSGRSHRGDEELSPHRRARAPPRRRGARHQKGPAPAAELRS